MPIESALQHLLESTVNEHPEIQNAVLSIHTPTLAWSGAAGDAQRDPLIPMQPQTQFRSASIGKMICAAALLTLVDEGSLRLDAPITEYLPPSITDGLSAITVRQLLNHTSGLADYFDEMVGDGQSFVEQMYADTHKLWQPVEILEWVKTHTRPQFTAGTRWSYTDTGFLVAGLLIEAVTGQPLHSVYRQRVFDPLGMAHTYLVFREDERPSIVGQREADAFIGDLNYTLPRTTSADWAGGGLVTTAADLQRFIRAAADARLFSRIETQAAMLSWIPTGEAGVYYGLGVRRFVPSELGEPDLGEVWGHSGALKSFMFYSPSLDATLCGTLNQAVTEGVWSDVRPIAPLMPATLRLLTTNAAR